MNKPMNKKIGLSRETVRRLDDDSLGRAHGGANGGTFSCTCPAMCVQDTEYSCDGVAVTRTCPTIKTR